MRGTRTKPNRATTLTFQAIKQSAACSHFAACANALKQSTKLTTPYAGDVMQKQFETVVLRDMFRCLSPLSLHYVNLPNGSK